MRNDTMKTNTTLARERGITDGGRHASHRKWLSADAIFDNKIKYKGWADGFEIGVVLQERKQVRHG